MNPRRKSRLKIVLFVLFGVAVAFSLVLYALRQNIDLFYTPTEVIYGKMMMPIRSRKWGNVSE